MSVAFRRESDEEHLQPKFERPIPNGPNLVTRRGLRLTGERVAELEAQLATVDERQRPALERELRYWRTRLVTAVEAPLPGSDEVEFGSRVRVRVNLPLRPPVKKEARRERRASRAAGRPEPPRAGV